MSRLIKLQLRNVFHSKLFYVCLGITLLLSPIVTYIGAYNMKMLSGVTVCSQIVDLFKTEVGIISSIFIALFCTSDFNDGTTKNIIGRGYSKVKLLLSKYIVSLIALFAMYAITILVIFVLFFKSGLGYESGMMLIIITSIFKIIASTVFFGTISFLLEKNGSAIIACMFVPNIIPLALGLVDSYLNLDISKYWLDNVADKFLTHPTIGNMGMPIIFYIGYTIAIILIGMQFLKNKEIK